ncbi:MAG: YkgJ family cysteine cluster protein [Chitinophagales bacterium]
MTPELQKILEKSASRKKQSRKFLNSLAKEKSGKVNQMAHSCHDEAFETINCLDCANCCKTTGPLFKQKDIERLAAHLQMRPADFTEKYLRIDEDGDYVLQTVPCPFLGADNYCSVYEVRPKACREYPHTDFRDFHKITKLTAKNTQICPAAYMVVEKMQQYFENS